MSSDVYAALREIDSTKSGKIPPQAEHPAWREGLPFQTFTMCAGSGPDVISGHLPVTIMRDEVADVQAGEAGSDGFGGAFRRLREPCAGAGRLDKECREAA